MSIRNKMQIENGKIGLIARKNEQSADIVAVIIRIDIFYEFIRLIVNAPHQAFVILSKPGYTELDYNILYPLGQS